MTLIVSILNALVAIPKIADLVTKAVETVVTWYVQRQTAANKQAIIDALAFGLHAQTEEDRYEAAAKWQKALSRARVTND